MHWSNSSLAALTLAAVAVGAALATPALACSDTPCEAFGVLD
jgi:hypothetical protein